MSPKEFRKNILERIEQGMLFAYQFPEVGGKLIFMEIPLDSIDATLISASLEEVKLMFAEDEIKEKADMK